jgi:arylsulfatase A-like enzyme
MREPSTRIPLIITSYGAANSSYPSRGAVLNISSHVDIVPTIAELVGAAPLPNVRGSSLVPFLSGIPPPVPRKDFAVAEYHSNLANTGSFMIRRGQWKLITYGHTFSWFNATSFVDQLFDVDADPFELTNVAAANPDVVSELFAQLEEELGGGPGAVAAIDRYEMLKGWKLFSAWFADPTNATASAELIAKAFRGNSLADVEAQYAAWNAEAGQLGVPL